MNFTSFGMESSKSLFRMNLMPESAYESYCDGCGKPHLKMTEMKLKGQEHGLHYCCHSCSLQMNKVIQDICLAIPSFPKNLAFEKSEYTNKVIYPRQEIKNPDKILLITRFQNNLQELIASGKIVRPIPPEYNSILIVMESWFATK